MTKLFCLLFSLLGLGLAQQTPYYLLSQLPSLDFADPISGELDETDGQNLKDGSRVEAIKLYLSQGDTVELLLASPDFDTFLAVYDPAGALLTVNDDTDVYGESKVTIQAALTGRYLVMVSAYSERDLGSYVLSARRLELVDDSKLELGSEISAAFTQEDELFNVRYLDIFKFELSEPQMIELSMRSQVLDSYLVLLSEDGAEIIAENDDDEESLNAMIVADLKPGRYVIWATTMGETIEGYYTLSLHSWER
jgi:hypothetical protein